MSKTNRIAYKQELTDSLEKEVINSTWNYLT